MQQSFSLFVFFKVYMIAAALGSVHYCDWPVYISIKAWPKGYKTFFMLNSTEHEISTAHKN